MNRFSKKLYRFFYGRYGPDELYKFCLILYFVLIIINFFITSQILTVIELLLLVVILYRSLSKNTIKRRKENEQFLKLKNKCSTMIKRWKKRWKDRNTHIYKKCPNCKTTLRLPLKKGTHTVKCPKCHHRFPVKCRRDEKIKVEVIKNK